MLKRLHSEKRNTVSAIKGSDDIMLMIGEHDYVRPLSRAAVTALMRAFSTPSVAV